MYLSNRLFRFLFLSLSLITLDSTDVSQSSEPSFICHSDAAMAQLYHERPDLKRLNERLDSMAANVVQPQARGSSRATYTLPIVFHVIHNNGNENIQHARILTELQNLNDAYANVANYDPSTGVDTGIEFCLALRDPEGNASNGVTRHQSQLTDMIMETEDLSVKSISNWKSEDYINVWIVRDICSISIGCGVAGYARFPTSHGQVTDGVVIEAANVGVGTGPSAILVHEIGHYLGLYHTFQGGCLNADCAANGDRVCDTPPDQSTAAVPCDSDVNSCNTDTDSGFASDQNDMFINYMDYGDWDCYSAFTPGQTDRMHFFIQETRHSLLNSNGCQTPCESPLSASFSVSPTSIIDVGTAVYFPNLSAQATRYEWYVDNQLIGISTDMDYVFSTEGTYSVVLYAFNNDMNCLDSAVQVVQVICPVEAVFTIPGEIGIGESALFVNQSNNATNYNWTVNGTFVSADADLNYTFMDESIYQICLEADNGLCTDQYCIYKLVDSVDPCAITNFYKTIGDPFQHDFGSSLSHMPNGNVLLATGTGGQSVISEVDVKGEVQWSKSCDFIPGKREKIVELFSDSEGNWIGTGYGFDANKIYDAFAFKFDATFSSLHWVTNIYSGVAATDISEIEPGGDYAWVLFDRTTQPPGIGSDVFISILDRDSGENLYPLTNVSYGSAESLMSSVIHQNEIYAVGRYNSGAAINGKRGTIAKYDLAGNEIWTKMSFRPLGYNARLYGKGILIEDNQIITLHSGNEDGTDVGRDVHFFLQFTDLDGNMIKVMRYDVDNIQGEWSSELVSTPDGYLMSGYIRADDYGYVILKVDKQGNFLWAKHIDSEAPQHITSPGFRTLLFAGDAVFFTGYTRKEDGDEDAILVRLNADDTPEDCDQITPLSVTWDEMDDVVSFDIDVKKYSSPNVPFQMTKSWNAKSLECETICEKTCEELCNNDLDDDQDGLVDCDDPDLRDSCCCKVIPALNIGSDTIVCVGEEVTFSANSIWDEYNWNTGATTPSIDVSSPGVYWLEVSDTCGNLARDTAVLDIFQLQPPPDLGPDVTICQNGSIAFDPGPNYLEYEWMDGSTDPVYTAWLEGLYWVRVWDGCRWQSDSVRVYISDPILTLPSDTVLCREDSLIVHATGFDTYRWIPGDLVHCDTCAQVKFLSDTSAWLIVVAQTNLGCIEVDSMYVEILNFETFDTIQICEGDTLVLFGQPVFATGSYSNVLQSIQDCDSVSWVFLDVLESDSVVEELEFCDGDSIVIFQDWVTLSGSYSALFQNRHGCDSVHTYDVMFRPNSSTNQYFELCNEDTIIINGVPVFTPGDYDQVFTNKYGCDSVVTTRVYYPGENWPLLLVDQADCDTPYAQIDLLSPELERFGYSYDLDDINPWPGSQVLQPGIHEIFVIDNYTLCYQIHRIEILELDMPFVDVPSEYIIESGSYVQINATISDDVVLISWTPDAEHSCSDCPNPLVNPLESTTYVIEVMDEAGCTSRDTVDIIVVPHCDRSLYIPNTFSPNADGINDVFEVLNITKRHQILALKVFDRWGGVCYESTDPIPSWNGKTGGKENNSGVYTYVLELICPDGRFERIVGDITLLK